MRTLVLSATAAAALAWVACNNTTSNPVTPTAKDFRPPTGLLALSMDGAVMLYWTASADAGDTSCTGYRIVYSAAGTVIDSVTASRTDTAKLVSGLNNGTAYSFTIRTTASDGSVGSVPATIAWGPGQRYTNIKLYSLAASASCPSGLQLSPTNVRALSVSQNGTLVDLVFDDRGTSVDLLPPLKSTAVGVTRHTLMDRNYARTAASLDDRACARAIIDTSAFEEGGFSLGADSHGGGQPAMKGEVFYARTQDGYYARIYVHADATGNELMTETAAPCTGQHYILIDVSFQPTAGVPYARPQRGADVGSAH